VVLTYPGIPETAAALIQAYGARLAVTTRAGRWKIIREGMAEHGWYPATNVTDIPTNGAYGHEGYKTIAYELHNQLGGDTPDLVAVPTAYAEGLFGIWKGFDELVRLGRARTRPRLIACEPTGGPLGTALEQGGDGIATVPVRRRDHQQLHGPRRTRTLRRPGGSGDGR
jgi:threonine synthase